MKRFLCPVENVKTVGEDIRILTFSSPEMASSVEPGQFVNIRAGVTFDPLLRRPFSVYRANGTQVEVIFSVFGKGTQILSTKQRGDVLDVIGPLGSPFSVDRDDFATGILVGGGLGVAPLPLITTSLRIRGKSVVTFLGARSSGHLVEEHLENTHVATDDGSRGHKGNVIELLERFLDMEVYTRPRLFGCGPTPMLEALAHLAIKKNIPCEVSLEGPMACGIGICQGCPVEVTDGGRKYALMCTEGPAFDVRRLRLSNA